MRKIIILFSLFFSISFYGQNDTISIVRHTDNDFIIPKNLKVVYRGLPNEFFIDVPNCKSFKVSGNGLVEKSKNVYYFNTTEELETIITVEIVLKNNQTKIEKHRIQTRNLSELVTTFNHQKGKIFKLQKEKLQNAIINLVFEDGNVQTDFILLVAFKLKITGRNEIEVQGNRIDTATYNEIKKHISRFDKIVIYEIKTIIRCGISAFNLNPIVIEIL